MATTRKQIGYGSQGSEVKELQNLLNKSGYNLSADGIFGAKTQEAVKAYQKANGLAVDGIVGNNTWGSLVGGSGSSSTSSATKTNPYTKVDLTPYDGGFKQSDKVTDAYNKSSDAEKAWQDYLNAGFTYGRQEDYKGILDKILNREDFSYDLNGDALYQQYKDKYIQQGKMAMQDTMGQAAAMTGGYGNSYATTAGNQAYQASLQNLNDIVPELYQMAYDKYNQEGQELYSQYSLLSDDRNTEYGMWADKGNKLLTDRDYYTGRADTEYGKEYGQWSDNRTYDTNQYWSETNFGYGKERDEVADEQWQKSFEEGQRQYNTTLEFNKAQASKSSSSSGSGGSGGSEDTGTAPEFASYTKAFDYVGKVLKDYGEKTAAARIEDLVNNGTLSEADAVRMAISLGLDEYYEGDEGDPTPTSHTPTAPTLNPMPGSYIRFGAL